MSEEISPPPLVDSVAQTIGNTPMVELKRLLAHKRLSGRLLAKLEYFNPGFSKKDRIALEMVRQAKADGKLREGQTVIELTSGNTGTGLAIVCRALGHQFIAVMSRGNSIERAWMMRALGAEVVLVDQAPTSSHGQVGGNDLALVEHRTAELVNELGAFRADQFHYDANVLAHERYTGPEIWKQSQGKVDVFVDFVGSGGSFTGIARYLKRQNPKLRAYLLEPTGQAVLAGQTISRLGHKIQGGGYSMPDLPLLQRDLVTDYMQITDEQAIAGARLLASEEGIFGGFSGGANCAAAMELLEDREAGATIAFLICDSGLKYMSTDLVSKS
jgi:cysteine synthase